MDGYYHRVTEEDGLCYFGEIGLLYGLTRMLDKNEPCRFVAAKE